MQDVAPLSGSPSSSSSSSPPGGAPATAEADAALYYVFVEQALQRGSAGCVASFLTNDFVEHHAGRDRDGGEFATCIATRQARYPDAAWTIELLVTIGSLVVCYMTMTVPELTGQHWETIVSRFEGGKIAECWRMSDNRLVT